MVELDKDEIVVDVFIDVNCARTAAQAAVKKESRLCRLHRALHCT